MSYPVDKARFMAEYEGKARRATEREKRDAWRARFIAERVEVGDTVAGAELRFLRAEGIPALTPNPPARSLPGGHPYDLVLEVTLYAKPSGRLFAGALMETRGKKRCVELTGSHEERLFRLCEASDALQRLLRETGQRRGLPLGFTELDAIVKRFSDDPQGFWALTEKDPDVSWLTVMPRAAVLARWGPKGDRVVKRLPPQK